MIFTRLRDVGAGDRTHRDTHPRDLHHERTYYCAPEGRRGKPVAETSTYPATRVSAPSLLFPSFSRWKRNVFRSSTFDGQHIELVKRSTISVAKTVLRDSKTERTISARRVHRVYDENEHKARIQKRFLLQTSFDRFVWFPRKNRTRRKYFELARPTHTHKHTQRVRVL